MTTELFEKSSNEKIQIKINEFLNEQNEDTIRKKAVNPIYGCCFNSRFHEKDIFHMAIAEKYKSDLAFLNPSKRDTQTRKSIKKYFIALDKVLVQKYESFGQSFVHNKESILSEYAVEYLLKNHYNIDIRNSIDNSKVGFDMKKYDADRRGKVDNYVKFNSDTVTALQIKNCNDLSGPVYISGESASEVSKKVDELFKSIFKEKPKVFTDQYFNSAFEYMKENPVGEKMNFGLLMFPAVLDNQNSKYYDEFGVPNEKMIRDFKDILPK